MRSAHLPQGQNKKSTIGASSSTGTLRRHDTAAESNANITLRNAPVQHPIIPVAVDGTGITVAIGNVTDNRVDTSEHPHLARCCPPPPKKMQPYNGRPGIDLLLSFVRLPIGRLTSHRAPGVCSGKNMLYFSKKFATIY